MISESAYVHPTSHIEDNVTLEDNVKVWHNCQIRKDAIIRKNVNLGKGVFVDTKVEIKQGSRVQNSVNIYQGVNIDEWCFVGPNVTFTNDSRPRSGSKNWEIHETTLKPGASVGAGAIISHGVTIGSFALIGAGSILTTNIPSFHLAFGFPARPVSKICACGSTRLDLSAKTDEYIQDCCHDNLKDEVIALAKKEIEKIKNESK
jgi:UDP-2-acetamido-3-amino-2,3-dideoxy-glucuronate N-acetyltransferase